MSMARRYRRHLAWKRYEQRMERIPGAVSAFVGAGRAWDAYWMAENHRWCCRVWRGHVQKGEARGRAAA